MLRMFRSIFKNPAGIPNYQAGPRYDTAGAAAFVLQPEYYQPLIAVQGPGAVPRRSLKLTDKPLYYGQLAVIQNGLGGIQTGQLFFSPLTDSSGGQ